MILVTQYHGHNPDSNFPQGNSFHHADRIILLMGSGVKQIRAIPFEIPYLYIWPPLLHVFCRQLPHIIRVTPPGWGSIIVFSTFFNKAVILSYAFTLGPYNPKVITNMCDCMLVVPLSPARYVSLSIS